MKSNDYIKGYEDAKEIILKLLYNNYIRYCEQQNGMPECKNCGLNTIDVKNKIVEYEQNQI